MATIALDASSIESTIKQGTVFVDFWAPWCGPCRAFGPVFEKVSTANPDVTFAKVNTQEQPSVASAFGIQAIPTLMVFRDGVLLYAQPGALPASALQRLVDEVKRLDMSKVLSEAAASAADVNAA